MLSAGRTVGCGAEKKGEKESDLWRSVSECKERIGHKESREENDACRPFVRTSIH